MEFIQCLKVNLHCLKMLFLLRFNEDHRICRETTVMKINDHRVHNNFYFCMCGYNDSRVRKRGRL